MVDGYKNLSHHFSYLSSCGTLVIYLSRNWQITCTTPQMWCILFACCVMLQGDKSAVWPCDLPGWCGWFGVQRPLEVNCTWQQTGWVEHATLPHTVCGMLLYTRDFLFNRSCAGHVTKYRATSYSLWPACATYKAVVFPERCVCDFDNCRIFILCYYPSCVS